MLDMGYKTFACTTESCHNSLFSYTDELVVCILATQIYRWGHACLRLSLLNQNLFICNAAPLEHSHKEEDRAETLQETKELKRWREREREREREEWLLWWKEKHWQQRLAMHQGLMRERSGMTWKFLFQSHVKLSDFRSYYYHF